MDFLGFWLGVLKIEEDLQAIFLKIAAVSAIKNAKFCEKKVA